ncbi:hypothetical protein EJB05_23264 [Eragrostis curvula]|uniref:Uncharacterized protein n=1 Tax=Eragrostis curvula TaxID=38414 RepID=A0A5J9V7R5_9POAL|nr:hypothetical protein EJB05_23264 [Eragrostis curvula]
MSPAIKHTEAQRAIRNGKLARDNTMSFLAITKAKLARDKATSFLGGMRLACCHCEYKAGPKPIISLRK